MIIKNGKFVPLEDIAAKDGEPEIPLSVSPEALQYSSAYKPVEPPGVKPQVFWLDDWNGTARGGLFLRNDLKVFFERLKAQGIKPVAIKFDGTYNLEIITDAATDKRD